MEPRTPDELTAFLVELRRLRNERKGRTGRRRRSRLTLEDRKTVWQKTEGRCHICGGQVDGDWQADHVLAHSAGGDHDAGNYLAAHKLCNNYRWDYLPHEFQLILKLGVWTKTQIQRRTPLGRRIAEDFVRHEAARERRRRGSFSRQEERPSGAR